MRSHTINDRKSNRLARYDYSQPGAYFVTIGSHHRKQIFGQVADGIFTSSPVGAIVEEEWFRSEQIRAEIELDAFILMPNHLNGIVWISGTSPPEGAHGRAPLRRRPRTLGSFVAGFKSITTRKINQLSNTPYRSVWQRNYYDHIIRNDRDLNRLRAYILQNPLQWEHDRYYFPK